MSSRCVTTTAPPTSAPTGGAETVTCIIRSRAFFYGAWADGRRLAINLATNAQNDYSWVRCPLSSFPPLIFCLPHRPRTRALTLCPSLAHSSAFFIYKFIPRLILPLSFTFAKNQCPRPNEIHAASHASLTSALTGDCILIVANRFGFLCLVWLVVN
jgi:hypothetical protein